MIHSHTHIYINVRQGKGETYKMSILISHLPKTELQQRISKTDTLRKHISTLSRNVEILEETVL